ncbi:14363_t:CDS:10 [Funneliformis caledonium]|uniref:14363_t:CDS:1 n=1 Tax=Funneliformis caledonium TaxID=1117310 RepID=A0A9N8ZK25_9GLOM|nr:14363_t:CDS:10 [Funneliformis caledonium]
MNPQRIQRAVAPSGYSNPLVLSQGIQGIQGIPPQYQYRPAPYQSYGQSQYIQPQRPTMANTNQPRPILASQHAGPSTLAIAPVPTVIRKRINPDPPLNIGSQQSKKKRAVERNIPEKLNAIVPESRFYTELQEFERRLDTTITRKRLEIQETINKPMRVKRTLRVFISNTAINQNPVQRETDENELEYCDANTPAWILRIEGRLLDWNKASSSPDGFNGFEIKRKGDTNLKCKIYFNLEHIPQKYKLSEELADLLDIHEGTKPGIIMALWQYIKLFSCPRMIFPQMPELLNKHLQPLDPIVIEYTIRVDKDFHQSRYAYDIEVEFDDPNKTRLPSIFSNVANQREIQTFDDKIVQCVQSINNSKTKRDFLLNFAKSPVEFINKWVESQSRDLELILGEHSVNLEDQRRSNFYKQNWVSEAVFHYSNALTQKKMHELLGSSNSGIKNDPKK